jgi:RNA polymerase sigma-70 factor (ECF subfamily)
MSTLSELKEFNKLFNEYNERFIRFACGYVKERLVAEDIVSEAFMVYWENRHRLKPDTNPPAYILTIIKNRCLNHLQREQMRLHVTEELKNHSSWVLQTKINTLEACDPNILFTKELQAIINGTLQQLPTKTRRVFILSRNHGMTYNEIARTINLSEKSVEFHISKALSKLRKSLKKFFSLFPFV